MNELTINLQNVSEEDKKVLLAIMEKSQKKESKVWIPEEGEECYEIFTCGDMEEIIYKSEYGVYQNILSMGFIVKTEKEAVNKIEKLKIEKELGDFAKEHNEREITWDGEYENWHMYYNCDVDKIHVGYSSYIKINTIYFSSETIAKSAIDHIGADRLKKYWFGVEE